MRLVGPQRCSDSTPACAESRAHQGWRHAALLLPAWELGQLQPEPQASPPLVLETCPPPLGALVERPPRCQNRHLMKTLHLSRNPGRCSPRLEQIRGPSCRGEPPYREGHCPFLEGGASQRPPVHRGVFGDREGAVRAPLACSSLEVAPVLLGVQSASQCRVGLQAWKTAPASERPQAWRGLQPWGVSGGLPPASWGQVALVAGLLPPG